MSSLVFKNTKYLNLLYRYCSSANTQSSESSENFERVFSLPTIRYIALINRLKVYQMVGSAIIIPGAGILDIMNTLPGAFLSATYIGVTGAAVLSLGTWPFRSVIGHIYISEDNKKIKISSVDFWGRRIDRVVDTEEWIPILDLKPNYTDPFFLSPQLTDGTKYKLPVKFGNVLNSKKMGEILE